MRILIDTNIIIPLEDSSKILSNSLSELIRLASDNGHQILVHPKSSEDIKRDKKEDRKKSILSRLKKYMLLEDSPLFSKNEIERFNLTSNSSNDQVDNAILAAIYNNASHWLITEDIRIHKKANRLGIINKVYYIQQAVDALKHLYPKKYDVKLPNLQKVKLHKLNIKDTFFNSLRKDYTGFDNWFIDKSAEGREAYIVKNDLENLDAILILKEEKDEIVTNDGRALIGNSLKISTFKVGEEVRGQKIGELFLKSAFEYARINNLDYIYLTIHPEKHNLLQNLCFDFGFYEFGIDKKSKRDLVYVKENRVKIPNKELSAFEFYRKYSPSFICKEVKKFIIPIQPRYHEILFPEKQRQPSLFMINKSAGNTIKKAYLSHTRLKKIGVGDLLLFYRSNDLKSVTTLAIVEKFFTSKDVDVITAEVAKRTVYSFEDIEKMSKKNTKVMLFRQILHLKKGGVTLKWLLANNIINGNIQSATTIKDEAFRKIIKQAVDEDCIEL